jgi:hypothetical protein
VDKIADDKKSIHLVFGSSMHHVIQSYLYVEYNKRSLPKDPMVNDQPIGDYIIREGKKIVDFDTSRLLKDTMYKEVKKLPEEERDDSLNTQTMTEFFYDGVAICDYLKKKRSDWFLIRGYELVDIEFELKRDLKENLTFTGFIDILLKDKSWKLSYNRFEDIDRWLEGLPQKR